MFAALRRRFGDADVPALGLDENYNPAAVERKLEPSPSQTGASFKSARQLAHWPHTGSSHLNRSTCSYIKGDSYKSCIQILMMLLVSFMMFILITKSNAKPFIRRNHDPSQLEALDTNPDRPDESESSIMTAHTSKVMRLDNVKPVAWLDEEQPVVCLIGNAQTVEMARTASAWFPTFHAFWAIWDQPIEDVTQHQHSYDAHTAFRSGASLNPTENTLFFPFPCAKRECSWKLGIDRALAYARASGIPCEYYFTSDDDCDWFLSNDSRVISGASGLTPSAAVPEFGSTVEDELLYQLQKYRPAVASFSWEYGDHAFEGAAALTRATTASPSRPLTAYNNGNALYHASVIDFVIPFAPSGEGGFFGNWTLPAAWLNMIVPFAFQRQALRINTVVHTNNVNMNNNGKVLLGQKPKTFIKDGLFFTEAARHPYEFPQRKAYEHFLSLGIVPLAGVNKSDIDGYLSYRWGPHLSPDDVTWTIETSQLPFTPARIKAQMQSRFDVSHEAVAYAFSRWERAYASSSSYHVAQLLSTTSPARIQRTLSRILSKDTSNVGLLSIGAVVHVSLAAVSIGVQTMNDAQDTEDIMRSMITHSSGFQPVSLSAHHVALNPVSASLEIVLEAIWKSALVAKEGVVGTGIHPTVLVLLHHQRRVPRLAFQWFAACITEFGKKAGVVGCALHSSSQRNLARGLFVRSQGPIFGLLTGNAAHLGTVASDTTAITFDVHALNITDVIGVAITRTVWLIILERCKHVSTASESCANAVQSYSALSGEDNQREEWTLLWNIINHCALLPTGDSGFVSMHSMC